MSDMALFREEKVKLILTIIFLFIAGIIYMACNLKKNKKQYATDSSNPDSLSINTQYIFSDKNLTDYKIGDKLPVFNGVTADGKRISLESKKLLNIIIYFQLDDCPSCLLESIIWKRLQKIYSDKPVKLYVIGYAKNRELFSRHVRLKKYNFPVIFDKDSGIRKRLKIKNTPVRMITDKNFTILDIERCTDKSLNDSYLEKKIQKFYNLLSEK